MSIAFFSSMVAYRVWIARMPAIFSCQEEGKHEDPCEPWASTTEGPYYHSPEYLLLRVGSGRDARYCALQRVPSKEVANFYWYVSEEGGNVYAAYVWDTTHTRLVAGETIESARAYLSSVLQETKLPLMS